MKHYVRPGKLRDLYHQELVQRILDDEQKLAASRAKLQAERATQSAARAAEDGANLTAQLQAAPPAAETPAQDQPAVPTTDSQIQKEIQQMSSTPVAHAKAALRAKASHEHSTSESASLPVHAAAIPSSDTPELDHHSRKCQVCRHPHRETIEELFVNWHSPRDIAEEFDGNPRLDWPSIYRHARSLGLYAKRSRNLRAVFDLVLENASAVTPTAQGIVAVVRAYSALTENNTWVEPEKRVHVINHIYRHELPAPSDVQAHSPEASQTSSTPPPSTEFSSTTAPDSNLPSSDFQEASFEPPAHRPGNVCPPGLLFPPKRTPSPGRTSKPNRNTPELKFPLSHT